MGAEKSFVFVSYDHLTEGNEERVKKFVSKLRADGLCVEYDQCREDGKINVEWPGVTEYLIDTAEYVLMVITPLYKKFFNSSYKRDDIKSRRGEGVNWEARIIRTKLMEEQKEKCILIIFDGFSFSDAPPCVRHVDHYEVDKQSSYDDLVLFLRRHLNKPNQDEKKKPKNQSGGVMARDTIQVIGWPGIQPPELYSKFMETRYALAFLTTQLSMETLPTLEYIKHTPEDQQIPEAQAFDVVFMDYEFQDRYRNLNKIIMLDNHTKIMNLMIGADSVLHPAIMSVIDPEGLSANIYSVPIQFGFQDILINMFIDKNGDENEFLKKIGTNDGEEIIKIGNNPLFVSSHKMFEIKTLIENGIKVALWHWYLPTMIQILLSVAGCEIVPLFDSLDDEDSAKKYTSLLREYFIDLSRFVKSKKNMITICRNMDAVRQCLRGGNQGAGFRAGVVLGVGSASIMQKCATSHSHIIPVICKEGLPIWINCAASISGGNNASAARLIKYWLAKDVQQTMFINNSAYLGLPVHKAVLDEVLSSDKYDHVCAVRTLKAVYNDEYCTFSKFENHVQKRILPSHVWGEWTDIWEQFVESVRR
jgi:hypothetical protein